MVYIRMISTALVNDEKTSKSVERTREVLRIRFEIFSDIFNYCLTVDKIKSVFFTRASRVNVIRQIKSILHNS